MRRILLALAVAVALSLGLVATSATHAEATPKAGTPAHWQKDYHRDWFATAPKCRKWGWGALYGNEVQKRIPYVDAFNCHKYRTDRKYSISLHWETIPPRVGTQGAGCGGGGGGGGSFSVKPSSTGRVASKA